MGAGASTQVQPRYKWNQDHVLRGPWTFLFKEKVQCACEGSKWCTREDPAKQKGPNAIPGLHSSWVGEHVLAMARPWQSAIESGGLVAAFQKANIGMVLNLQEVGEHASCGPGNLPHTGFTYDPEAFMAGGVGYYNFAWRDMGVPSLERMMDIVQVMDYVTRVEGRKIAVHCHAGLGRTGLAIACFLVFAGLAESPEAAIQAVRKHRPGAVQTSRQVAFVTIFGQYLQHLRCIFPPAAAGTAAAAAASPGRGGAAAADAAGLRATQSVPPAAMLDGAAAAAGLPQKGLIEKKETAGAVVGVYDSGLTVSVPLQAPGAGSPGPNASAHGGAASGGADSLTDEDVGLTSSGTPLPWTESFHIQPRHAAGFRPRPPRSYSEALARQARLLHGPERRAFLKLYKFLKEAVFAVIAAAQTFHAAHPPPVQPSRLSVASSASSPVAVAAAGPASPSGAPGRQLPPTFAHALAQLLAHHSATHVDSEGLQPLAAHPAYVALTGPQVDAASVFAALSGLREQLNAGRTGALASAPVLLLVMALEGFFGAFAGGPEPACLTKECLSVIANSYQSLFDSRRPPTPGSARASATNAAVPSAATDGAATPSAAAASASSPSLELARQAYEVLEPLQPRDAELLLLFAALLRVVARGSGPGCEEAVVAVGKWAVGLLLGSLAKMPEAEEATLSFLWYLAGRDEAYAMLLLLKRQRLVGGGPLRKRGAADVAAMLAAAASMAAPPPTPPGAAGGGAAAASLPGVVPHTLPPLPPAAVSPPVSGVVLPFPMSPGSEVTPLLHDHDHEHDVSAASPAGAASVRDSLASVGTADGGGGPRPGASYDAGDPTLLPALQLAQLLSADIQQLYRTSFREAIAGIATVVYPPPPATGLIEVHDVWR